MEYLTKNIFKIPNYEDYIKAFANADIENPEDLLLMSHPQIDSFKVNPSKHKTAKRITIAIGYANKIKYFKDYMLYKAKIGKPILDIRNIDMQDYIWMQTKQWEMKRTIDKDNFIY